MDRESRILKTLDGLKSNRSNWESYWNELATYVWTDMYGAFDGTQINGAQRNLHLYDGSTAIMVDRLASVMEAMICPFNETWHMLRVLDERVDKKPEIRKYFDYVNDLLIYHRKRPGSGFYAQMSYVFKSVVVFGTGVLFADTNENGMVRYKSIPLNEVYLRANFQNVIIAAYREFEMDVDELRSQFPDIKLPDNILADEEKQTGTKYKVIHSVEPSVKGEWESVYFMEQEQLVLGEGKYDTFPFFVLRYAQYPNEIYGRSAVMQVLPNVKTLNKQKRDSLIVSNKIATPTYLMPDDGILDIEELVADSYISGGMSADGRKLIAPLDSPQGQLESFKIAMEAETATINDALMMSLFQLLKENPRMTATEVLEKTREQSMFITPVMLRLQNDFGFLIERELSLHGKYGRIPEAPNGIKDYEISYYTPLTRMELSGQLSGMSRTLDAIMPIMGAAQDFSPLKKFDMVKWAERLAYANGVPGDLLRSDDEIAKIDAASAEQQQSQQMVEGMTPAANMIKALGSVGRNQ